MEYVLFYITILITHIIQGITGFAGTILAMPVSLRLVGTSVAVPVLNALGIAAGIYVLAGNHRYIDKKELLKILCIMIPFMGAGIFLRTVLESSQRTLYIILGIIVLLLSAKGIYDLVAEHKGRDLKPVPPFLGYTAIAVSGVVHGMFVCGGPLLIIYMADRIKKKEEFRATVSAVWVVLNSIMLITQIAGGMWSLKLLEITAAAVPVLFLAMLAGTLLYRKMSRKLFMIITYVLLVISGISLFFK